MPPSTLSAGMAHLIVILSGQRRSVLFGCVRLRGILASIVCWSANCENWIARSFRFCGRYREIVGYDCSDSDLRSFEQQGSDEPAEAQNCARINAQAAMILHERVGWKSEVQSIPMGVEK